MQPVYRATQMAKKEFRRAIHISQMTCTLRVTSATITANSYAAVVGDSPRTSVDHCIPCLYHTRQFEPIDRTKHGLHDVNSMLVYFAPSDLVDRIGTFTVDQKKARVVLHGIEYLVRLVEYLGIVAVSPTPFPDCVSVRLTLDDLERGGE